MRKPILMCVGTLALPIVLSAQSPSSVDAAVRSITPDDIAHRIGVIAHDSMRGRNTPSPGLEKTASYIATQFRNFGLKPGGGDGTYIQRYPIHEVGRKLSLEVTGRARWQGGRDIVQVGGGSTGGGVQARAVLVSGAGGRPSVPESLAGDVVFYVAQLNSSRSALSSDSRDVMSWIETQNPAAIVVVADFSDRSWSFFIGQQTRPQLVKGWSESPSGPPVLVVRPETFGELLNPLGLSLPNSGQTFQLRRLTGVNISLQADLDLVEHRAPNVVGILEGSDPVLKNEYLVYSAHMDHEGVGVPVNGDSIYNGADDDASGTIAVVEAAEAFAALNPRPKRSIIFLTVSGEEKGLFGSEYFAQNPPVPVEQIVANLNADMVGRNWRDTIVVIGKEHSDLGATLNRVNQEHPELNMTAIDDLWPQQRFYFRSDHYNFARAGVPILFFFNGTHDDYHRPSDEPDKIDAEKESRIVKLMFYLGLEVANAADKPAWNPKSYQRIVQGR